MKKTIATSATCGPCHVLKSRIEKLGIEIEIKEYNNAEHTAWFRQHSIRQVPSLVIESEESVEIIHGVEDIINRLTHE